MKHLSIKSLQLVNIAGIDKQAIDLSNDTSIKGSNSQGKTTIAHAIAWLFTGKDLTGSSKWAIKPKDKDGNDIHNLTCEVVAWVSFDGEEIALTKQMEECWERPKASEKYQLTGHNYYYYISNLSYSASEWKQWLTDNIAHPDTIRMLLTPHAFHNMHWYQRRQTLLSFLDVPEDSEIAQTLGLSIAESLPGKSAKDLHNSLNKAKKQVDEILLLVSGANHERQYDFDQGGTDFTQTRLDYLQNQRQQKLNDRATLEQQQDECNRVLQEKARLLEDVLASRYSPIRFKMFDKNGDMTCQTIVNGREWNELSQGEKIKAGLQLVEQLQKDFGVVVPILIDEHESVADTKEWPMPEPQGQKIRFYHQANTELSISNQ